MSEASDWREAAKADLLKRLAEARGFVERWDAAVKNAEHNRTQWLNVATDIFHAASTLGISLGDEPPSTADEKAGARTTREIILDALRDAYPDPMKAAELRKVIEKELGREVHYKTPGMTLYRLSDEKLVRRVGRNWYAVEGGQLRLDEQIEEAPIE